MSWNAQQGSSSSNDPYGVSPDPYGAPPTNPNYPPSQGYPPAQAAQGSPPSQGYPPASGYPPAQGYPPTQYPPAPGYQPMQGYQPTPGYPNTGPNQMDPTPSATPLPLGQAVRELLKQYIKVLTRPGPQAIDQEQSKASWNIIWVQLLIVSLLAAALSGFIWLTTYLSSSPDDGSLSGFILGTTVGMFLVIPAFFFLSQGFLYLLAKAFGGVGTFLRQSYASLLVNMPIGILVILIRFIPIVGSLGFFLWIYAIILQVFSTMAVHRLSGGKATAVVLIPFSVGLLLTCGLAVAFAALFIALVTGTHP